MSNIVFELFAKLGLDSSEYEQGLTDAESKAKSVGGSIANGLKTLGKVGAGITAVMGTATIAAGTTLVKGASEVAAYGDNIDKMSQKLGISAQAYQEWDAIMQHSGTSIESMSRGMQTLQKNAVNSADKFEALGISQEQLATMSTEELFSATITGLQNMGEGAERTALASELLGGSAKELGALLNTSAEDTEAMRQRVHELGGVMSDEAVKAAAAYQDSLQDMQTGFDGLKRNMMSSFLPSVTKVMDGLGNIFTGDIDTGLGQVSEGIDEAVSTITDVIPRALEVGVNIVEALATSLVENAPKLFPSLVNLVLSIGSMIIENLPMLIETGLSLILEIASGISQALPTLIPTIVEVILQIASTLIENIDLLVDAAIQLTIGLANGLIAALPVLIEKAPEIISKLVDALITNAPLLLSAAVTLIGALVQGIITAFPQLIESGKQILIILIDGIKSVFNLITQAALDLITKFIGGITDAKNRVLAVGKEIVDSVKAGIMQKIEDARTWGTDLIDNFIGGIKEKWDALKDTVSNVAGSVKDLLGFSEPKLGPLSNFHTYAPDMMQLFAKGVRDNEAMLKSVVAEAFDFGNLIATAPTMDMATVGAYGGGDFVQNITINSPTALTPSEIARQTRNATRDMALELRGKR